MKRRKYLVELKDGRHIITAEIKLTGPQILKPYGDNMYTVEAEDYQGFWRWLKEEKSFLPDEALDICVLCPTNLSPGALITSAQVLGVDISQATEITTGDAESYLRATGRTLRDMADDAGKTILCLASGEKILALGMNGGRLKKEAKRTNAMTKTNNGSLTTTKHKTVRHRPKAFTMEESPAVRPNVYRDIKPIASQNVPEKNVSKSAPPSKNALPKATAEDIQIGIRRITEEQCREVDFRE